MALSVTNQGVFAMFRAACLLLIVTTTIAIGQEAPTFKPIKPATPGNKQAGIELSEPQTINTNQRIAVVVASAEGPVRWEVAGGLKADELVGTNNLLVTLAGKPEVVTVTAWASIAGVPTVKATTTITVVAVGKTEKTQKISAVPKSAIFVFYPDKDATPEDKALRKAVNAKEFQDKLESMNLQFREMESTSLAKKELVPLVQEAGVPCLIIQSKEGTFLPSRPVARIICRSCSVWLSVFPDVVLASSVIVILPTAFLLASSVIKFIKARPGVTDDAPGPPNIRGFV